MYTGVLIGLFVLSISYSGVTPEEVNINTLPKIIRFFENNYKPSVQTSTVDGAQYAVAINVPAEQCGNAFDDQNFLSGDLSQNVKNKLTSENLYEGDRLAAATPKGVSKTSKIHSERALLMCEGSSHAVTPVQNLLNKDKNGCVVFYTYNSPCLKYCLNQAGDDDEEHRVKIQTEKNEKKKKKTEVAPAVKKCILNSLSMLTNHNGPRAFVFSKVYRQDIEKDKLASALEQVAKQVPLYKCGTNSCIKCLDNNQFNSQCTS